MDKNTISPTEKFSLITARIRYAIKDKSTLNSNNNKEYLYIDFKKGGYLIKSLTEV